MATTRFTEVIATAVVPSTCRWYAIADAAQERNLPGAIAHEGVSRCLLGATDGSPLAAQSPHLVSLPAPHSSLRAWQWIEVHAPRSPCVTVLASQLAFDDLFAHLQQFTEALLPDGDDMFFAFWDPAILGTLVGQVDDQTLHVPGPVLSAAQRDALTRGVAEWWYWDRDGLLHHIRPLHDPADEPVDLPIALTQQQVDQLVEASVPDHVLHYLELNQPHLLNGLPRIERYGVMRSHLLHARDVGLTGMRDLVNFACAGLIYGSSLRSDPDIAALLQRVRKGELSFDDALDQFPPNK